MSDNVVLLNSDKEILRGEREESDFQNYSTRRSQIRTRVRKRSKALLEEIQLLADNGESEVAEYLLEHLLKGSDMVHQSNLREQIERLESDLVRIEQSYSEVQRLKDELDSLRDMVENQND